jgi:mannose-1-phosphate guanylyltransferase
MKAMILAAGLGTRLRPLTDDRPKALVEINGRTLLEITLFRLRSFGVTDVIVNVHHFADKVVDYLKTNDNFGMRIEVSHEDALLDTGGGLKKAAWFLKDSGSRFVDAAPFILHNVDVLTTIDIRAMLQFHAENQALATLAVQARNTSRYLLFDEKLHLFGRRTGDGEPEPIQPASQTRALAFSGVHIISPRLLHHHVSASRGTGRKNPRLPRRPILLARSWSAGRFGASCKRSKRKYYLSRHLDPVQISFVFLRARGNALCRTPRSSKLWHSAPQSLSN